MTFYLSTYFFSLHVMFSRQITIIQYSFESVAAPQTLFSVNNGELAISHYATWHNSCKTYKVWLQILKHQSRTDFSPSVQVLELKQVTEYVCWKCLAWPGLRFAFTGICYRLHPLNYISNTYVLPIHHLTLLLLGALP